MLLGRHKTCRAHFPERLSQNGNNTTPTTTTLRAPRRAYEENRAVHQRVEGQRMHPAGGNGSAERILHGYKRAACGYGGLPLRCVLRGDGAYACEGRSDQRRVGVSHLPVRGVRPQSNLQRRRRRQLNNNDIILALSPNRREFKFKSGAAMSRKAFGGVFVSTNSNSLSGSISERIA
jgi:hypothetical protein